MNLSRDEIYIGLPVTGESDGAYWNAVTVDIQLLNARIEHVLTRGFKTYISILFLLINLKLFFGKIIDFHPRNTKRELIL